MALWLNRAGSNGEHENKFLQEGRIYFTWTGLNSDLSKAKSLDDFYAIFRATYPDAGEGKVQNNGRQASQFANRMEKGDWVALPSKFNPTIHFGKIIGDYQYDPNAEDRYFHWRKVEWFAQDIPRDRFDKDILNSLGAFLTVAQIQKNNAEERIHEMERNGWEVPKGSREQVKATPNSSVSSESSSALDEEDTDIAESARDEIARVILAKYKGHGLARLVKAILEAEGYEVYMPPEGPDKGVDLLAAPGNLGFGDPRICVQVKSTDGPVERMVLDQLIGVMQNFNADKGLLVSWGGFKQSIDRERAAQFFRVRLWDRDDLLEKLFETYDKLPETIRTELPLKRIWMLVRSE